jgi:hypothetical protein
MLLKMVVVVVMVVVMVVVVVVMVMVMVMVRIGEDRCPRCLFEWKTVQVLKRADP